MARLATAMFATLRALTAEHQWMRFSARERWMMGVGGLCLGLYGLYAVVYAPLQNAVLQKKQERLEKYNTWRWMQHALQQTQLRPTRTPARVQSLLSLVEDALKKSSFHERPYEMGQTGPNDLHLSFEAVPYPAVVLWLFHLSQQHALNVQQLNIERTNESGLVSCSMTIGR